MLNNNEANNKNRIERPADKQLDSELFSDTPTPPEENSDSKSRIEELTDEQLDSELFSYTPKPPRLRNARVLLNVLPVLAISLILIASAILGMNLYENYLSEQEAKSLAEQYSKTEQSSKDTVSHEQTFTETLPEFDPLLQQNPDTAGWITIDDTPIDYVVVQAEDNDYYLRRAFDGSDNRNGTIYLDYRSRINPKSKNVIIYGHNMKSTAMFSSLSKYTAIDYYREHPIVNFSTLYEHQQYKIFAVILVDASPEDKEADGYQLWVNFASNDSFKKYVDKSRNYSLYDIPVDVASTDKIITLITCSYDIDDGRYAILARALREGESAEVDTAAAVINSDVIKPN